MAKHKYNGLLAKKRSPVKLDHENAKISDALLLADELQTIARIRELFADCSAGPYFPQLEKGLGAAQVGWRQVAITLAMRHVPGFQYGRNKGRPPKPPDFQLLAEVEKALAKQTQPSIRQAAKSVATKQGKSETGLDRQYRRVTTGK